MIAALIRPIDVVEITAAVVMAANRKMYISCIGLRPGVHRTSVDLQYYCAARTLELYNSATGV